MPSQQERAAERQTDDKVQRSETINLSVLVPSLRSQRSSGWATLRVAGLAVGHHVVRRQSPITHHWVFADRGDEAARRERRLLHRLAHADPMHRPGASARRRRLEETVTAARHAGDVGSPDKGQLEQDMHVLATLRERGRSRGGGWKKTGGERG